MTRKDYVALAKALNVATTTHIKINGALTPSESRLFHSIVSEVADTLKADNRRFDRERFDDAVIPQTQKGSANA